MFVGKILSVYAEDALIKENGDIDFEAADLL